MAPATQVERRLLWHPRGLNKFIVGGGTHITMYEWLPDRQEIKHVASQNELQYMKVRFQILIILQVPDLNRRVSRGLLTPAWMTSSP